MTQGEIRFHLREVHAHWSTSHLSSESVAELVRQNLVVRSEDGVAIKLTKEGERQKIAARPRDTRGLNHLRKPERPPKKQQRQRTPVTRARPLV